jgi:hypothetical protein
MTLRLHVLDAANVIPLALRDAMVVELKVALPPIEARLALTDVDICFYANPTYCIPEEGMSGYATNAGLIHIVCDPDSPRLNDPERGQRVASTVAHELHHAARNQGPGYGKTLGEALVSEGLAQAFEAEMTGVTPFYAVALALPDLSSLAARALPELIMITSAGFSATNQVASL